MKGVIAAHLFAQLFELVDELATLEHPLHQQPQPFRVVRLRDEIVGAGLHGVERLFRIAECRQHDHPQR